MSKQGKRTGVVLVTHADYGAHLVGTAELILGSQEGVKAVGVGAGENMDRLLDAIRVAVTDTDQGSGVLLLTDMFGGTPTNLSLSLLGEHRVEVITGVNLPMLLKVLGSRHLGPQDLAAVARDAGIQGIAIAGEILRSKISD
jgi:PTS system mannose-specific IIA component